MQRLALIILLLLGASTALGQNNPVTLDDLVRSAEQWAKENLDEDTLRAFQGVDREKVNQFLTSIQKEFHGDYVIDLGGLKDTARAILPLLEQYEETTPYALWLRTRLEYLEVADQFRLIVPPPQTKPGEKPMRPHNPTPQAEREVWARRISERPWPVLAKAYVSRLKPVFTEEKVPPELVWLAEVESSFDPRARSPAGAAGLFQLMPSTAGRYGLHASPRDERLQPEPNARAAAKCLYNLHARFKDWRLTLAAYNAGQGTVQNLLTRHKARTFDAIATHLPAETQMYVPRIEATLLRREGVTLNRLDHAESGSESRGQ